MLLTAYADTDAAIDAINAARVDHYLLKPWHPAETKLYPMLHGQDVVVVGGGNSAGQAALHLARVARHVTILIRGENLDASMSRHLIDRIAASPNVTIRNRTTVVGASGNGHLERLELRGEDGETTSLEAAAMFVFIGARPRTDWLGDAVRRDRQGFVVTGGDLQVDAGDLPRWALERDPYPLESSLPGVFAAGDVRPGSMKRVASSVGGGAMAASLIHRYLATL